MSKSLNLFLPAAGGTAIVLALAFGIATSRDAADKVSSLERQVEDARQEAVDAAAQLQISAASTASLTTRAPISDAAYGLGRDAFPEEIAAWDVDVLPDGRGLPEGSGNAYDGEELFADKCGACHGDFAEGVDNWPVLAGGFDTLADEDPVKTVGSYWPHLSTVYDYIYRSMPFGQAGTLTPDETYAIVAYILYSNDMIEDDVDLTHENLAAFEMYNTAGFVVDDREAVEYSKWRSEPCMTDCKDNVQITMRSVFLVDTPPEGGSESLVNPGTIDGLPSFSAEGASFIPEPQGKPIKVANAASMEPEDLSGDALIAEGQKVFKKCSACHQVGNGAKNGVGPQLNGVLGREIGGVSTFKYSATFQTANDEGRVWDADQLAAFLANPKSAMEGTSMAFRGLKSPEDISALLAYLENAGK